MKLDKQTRAELKQATKEKKRCMKLYKDWKDDEYNCGPLKYLFGVLPNNEFATNWHQLTDLDVYYNRDTKRYMLGIETIYKFETIENSIKYLDNLCNRFYDYLKNNFDPNVNPFNLYTYNDGNLFQAESLSELYYKFKIFVEGYKHL